MSSVVVELRNPAWPDLVGYGEGYPDAYYGETLETIATVLPLLLASTSEEALDRAASDPGAGLAAIDEAFEAVIAHHGAAKCALDTAIHDLVGKRLGRPLYDLLGLSPAIGPTDFTVGIDEPEVVAARAARAARFPALKIKVGGPSDLDTLEAVRRVFAGPIRVDANTGWTPEQGAGLIPDLVRLGVELIEQPFPAHRLDQLRWLQERSELPLVADESAVTILDLEGLVGVVDGVNVKLAKCGGPGPARRMLARARELGFKTFLGLHGGDVAGDRRVGPRRDPGRLDRPRRLPADLGRPVRGPRAGCRLSLAADRDARPGDPSPGRLSQVRSPAAPADDPEGPARTLWTTWWTRSWTNPLPAIRGGAYHGLNGLGHLREEGSRHPDCTRPDRPHPRSSAPCRRERRRVHR